MNKALYDALNPPCMPFMFNLCNSSSLIQYHQILHGFLIFDLKSRIHI